MPLLPKLRNPHPLLTSFGKIVRLDSMCIQTLCSAELAKRLSIPFPMSRILRETTVTSEIWSSQTWGWFGSQKVINVSTSVLALITSSQQRLKKQRLRSRELSYSCTCEHASSNLDMSLSSELLSRITRGYSSLSKLWLEVTKRQSCTEIWNWDAPLFKISS